MKRFGLAAAVVVGGWLSVCLAQAVKEPEPDSLHASGETEQQAVPRIPNAVPPNSQDRPDKFLSDLQVGQPADYTEAGRLVISGRPNETDALPYKISRITSSYVELAAEDSILRLRSSAITAIHFQGKQPWKKPAKR